MRYPKPESAILELKRSFPQNDQIIKTLIGFCNQYGGKLVIGVGDDRSIMGLSQKELDIAMEWIEKGVFEASYPPIIPRLSILNIAGKNLLEIEVSEGMNKPYYRRSEGIEKGSYIRLGRNTVRATPAMIEELRWQGAGTHFETLPVHRATLEDLDRQKVNIFLSQRKNQGEDQFSLESLQSYGLATSEHGHHYPTTAGILLFGKAPQRFFSESMIICTHFQGTEGREVIATVDCEGSLFEQFNMAFDFLLSRLTRSFTIHAAQRSEELEIPKEAIREALLNAIVHRNYHHLAPTKVALWSDRIEIFSPGAFPGPIDIKNLRAGRTYLRNANICRILRESGYIEKLGSGFIVILDSYKKAGLSEPRVIDGGDFVKCILPRRSLGRVAASGDIEHDILALFDEERELSAKEIGKLLAMPRSTLGRILKRMVERGELERSGRTQSIRYRRKAHRQG